MEVRWLDQGTVQSVCGGGRGHRGRRRHILVGVASGGDGVGRLVGQEHGALGDVGGRGLQVGQQGVCREGSRALRFRGEVCGIKWHLASRRPTSSTN
jgi:hypothetical protein